MVKSTVPSPIDITSVLEYLGNPVSTFYTNPSDKAGIHDLQAFDGKIYIGHGTSNSSRATKIIHFDPGLDSFDVDRDGGGTVVEFQEEMLRHMRVFNGELYFEGYDPLGSQTRIYRKETEGWVQYNVGPDGHNRDIYKFGSRLFTNYGSTAAPHPRIFISEDDGDNWTLFDQAGLSTADTSVVYEEFFEFGGSLYVTGTNNYFDASTVSLEPTGQPWMLRFTGDMQNPFAVAHQDRSDFIPTNNGTEFVRRALTFDGALYFIWGFDLYSATSIEPAVTQLIDLPNQNGAEVRDLIATPDAVYALSRRAEGSTYRYSVYARIEEAGWHEWFNFTEDNAITSFEYHSGSFYFGAGSQFNPENGSHIWRYAAAPASVGLSSFEGTALDRDVLLEWNTSSESNIVGFEVEHRLDDGSSSYAPTAFVAGSGTSTSPQTYSQRLSLFKPGDHQFRLRHIGFDGSSSYSAEQLVTVEFCSP